MKDRNKKLLLVTGVGIVAYLIWRQMQTAQATPVATTAVWSELPIPTISPATSAPAIPVSTPPAPPSPPLDVTQYSA